MDQLSSLGLTPVLSQRIVYFYVNVDVALFTRYCTLSILEITHTMLQTVL